MIVFVLVVFFFLELGREMAVLDLLDAYCNALVVMVPARAIPSMTSESIGVFLFLESQGCKYYWASLSRSTSKSGVKKTVSWVQGSIPWGQEKYVPSGTSVPLTLAQPCLVPTH